MPNLFNAFKVEHVLSTVDRLTMISAEAREALFSFIDFLPEAGKNLLRLS